MEFMVLDKNYDGIAMIDTFTSAIWTVRYEIRQKQKKRQKK